MPDDLVNVRLESSDFSCDELQIYEVAGRESLGRLFEMAISVVTTAHGGLDLTAVEGATATLVFQVEQQDVRHIHGMIAAIDDFLDTQPETRSYRFCLVPRAHRLTLVRTQEIFMDLSTPDIIKKKLELVGLGGDDVEFRLSGTYAPREFVVQYQESDLDFISRLCEHEGITFFFEHDSGVDKMIFADRNDAFRPLVGHELIPFRGRGEKRDIYRVESTTRVVPKAHVVHDYNYRLPLVDPTGSADAASGFGGGIVEYGAHCKTPEEALQLAKIRAEETESKHRVFLLESDLAWIASSGVFTLEGHPKLGDARFLITDVTHSGRFPVTLFGGKKEIPYTNTFHALESRIPYRPERITPKPRIHGVVNGLIAHEIEGTESLFARLDDQGRYLVRLMFDTSQPGERQVVSRRIRMVQPHAGANYGHHFPLKPGTEVLVGFIDGDPDRPIIIGTAPNPITPSPVAQNSAPAHRIKTATGILIEMKDA